MIQSRNAAINKQAHIAFCCLFSRADHQSIGHEILPKYLEITLSMYPKATHIDSIKRSMLIIAERVSKSDIGLSMYCIEQLIDKINRMRRNKENSSHLIMVLINLIGFVDIQMLDVFLEHIQQLIERLPKSWQIQLCKLITLVLSRNCDYSRKTKCIHWYLDLVHQLALYPPPKPQQLTQQIQPISRL